MEKRDFSVNILDPKKIRISRDESGRLKIIFEGGAEVTVKRIIKAFPLTMPWRYIILIDENDQEIGVIKAIKDLDESSRRILVEQLEKSILYQKSQKFIKLKKSSASYYGKRRLTRGLGDLRLQAEET